MNHPYIAETRLRALSETCPVCQSRAGEPCQNGTKYPGLYRCPDPTCDQLYIENADAMNCVWHDDCNILADKIGLEKKKPKPTK